MNPTPPRPWLAAMLALAGWLAPATIPAHAAAEAAAPDALALLQDADRTRTGDGAQRIETEVSVLNADGTPDKERRYTVFALDGHRSLVLMRSPVEQGQKVLMLGDDFWLLMPGSQRPMRITPMQKLLGDASTGDIATLSWAEDYSGRVVGAEPCGEPAQPCWHLSLAATRPGVSYQRIELWLGQARREPVRADLYVQSARLAKQARFVMEPGSRVPRVGEMWLQDQLASRKLTRVRYLARQPQKVPESWLNPMFLARNPSLE